MKKSFIFLAFVGLLSFFSSCRHESLTASYDIIPVPREVTLNPEGGDFTLNAKTVITYPASNDTLRKDAEHLKGYLLQLTGHDLRISSTPETNNAINLTIDDIIDNPEGYKLTVSPEHIDISAPTSAGVFYGIQTLRKSIPAEHQGKADVVFPAVTITDFPRFAYRGAHFDVVRHFFPADSVKKFIDLLALHNINRFHWHITDDQGWRVEIKKHPRLTEIGSKRSGTVIGRNTDEYDTIPVEGFFTQDQIRDIVQYAADRHITIIPEIDLPGHMQAALAAYPQLGCTGGPYDVWQRWGVSEEVLCAGNDSVYLFLDDVLDEVSDLFPGEYFHVGGDECPKIRWEECVKCQARIRELGYKNDADSKAEEKLQSHVMKHAADFLAKKGKKIIGWDEILEGGATPDATIMSWRGEAGGIKAAEMGNDVIMTPNTYMYFDYYQTLDKENEPIAMNGYVPLEKVYSYEPMPSSLTPEQAAHIKGVQANLWAEYIKTFPHAMYMELPRMAALSEVQWTSGEEKDYDGFMKRLPAMMAHYRANGYPYSMRAYDVTCEVGVDTSSNTLSFSLKAPDGAPIYYTLDGSIPNESSSKYDQPVVVSSDSRLRAIAAYPFGKSNVYRDSVSFNKATARPVSLVTPPAAKFARVPEVLTDGKPGGDDWKADSWMGYHGTDAIVVVDLQQPVEISQVSTNTRVDTGSHVFDARKMSVALSDDGETWEKAGEESFPELNGNTRETRSHAISFPARKARYVRLSLEPEKEIPSWHPAKGKKGFLFIDEISVQ